MDRKTLAILAVCLALLFLWPQLVRKAFPPPPVQPGATNELAVATNTPTVTGTSAPATTAASAVATPVIAHPAFDTNAPEQTLVVTNDGARYHFTSRGGGLKSVELLKYPETVSSIRKKRSTAISEVATLNDAAPLPIGTLLDNGAAQGDGVFTLTRTATGVRAEKVLEDGLRVTKDFDFSSNYLVTATVRLQNGGAAAVALPAREIVVGTATPLGLRDKGYYQTVMWYDGIKAYSATRVSYFNTNTMMLGFFPRTPKTEYRSGNSNVVWVSAQNQFFTILAMPENPALQFIVRPVELSRDPETEAAGIPPQQGLQTSLTYPAASLAPGKAVEQKINFFAGPKEYRTLARIADKFNNNADLVMGYGGFIGGFSRALLLSMNWLHDFFRLPYGWAIVTITLIVKLAFWPLTAAGTRSMKRMQALQPQMKAIADKYKDDPAKKNQKTMEFMKEHKVNPMSGCLPMLIQMPILWGFYRMIMSAIELRGAPFLWIGDLSQPDTLFIIPGLSFVPLIGIPGVGLPVNLLPLIMGATQLWQSHLNPPSPGMDPGQQKMMRYMPLMFLFMFYNMSSGLTLYWTVSNLLTVTQTKLTKIRPDDPLLAARPKKGK